jgi:hypothetical protein
MDNFLKNISVAFPKEYHTCKDRCYPEINNHIRKVRDGIKSMQQVSPAE